MLTKVHFLLQGALDSSDTLNTLIQSPIVDPSWWLVVLGTVIFFIATAGCLGALRENTILLTIVSLLIKCCFYITLSILIKALKAAVIFVKTDWVCHVWSNF